MSNQITLQNIKNIYFLGIGGIGMSALARYFNTIGVSVKGYDKTPSALTDTLIAEGISIVFEDSIDLLDKDADLVVFTPAIPKNHLQYNWYLENQYNVRKRAYVLGLLTQNTYCIAVAGSHGKTTVSSMIAHILNETTGCTAFLGGIANNFQSNYICSNTQIVVVEADEYDRSFMTLKPNITVVTAIDTDHLDIYENFENIVKEFKAFALNNAEDGLLVLNESTAHLQLNPAVKSITYAFKSGNVKVSKYAIDQATFTFDVVFENEIIEDIKLHLPGWHNVENALAAIIVAKQMKISNEDIIKALGCFKGIYRRFEYKAQKNNWIYIDDYAHHPNEVKALLSSVKEMYPNYIITAIFQPHLFSRTKDLANDFGVQLSIADTVVILPIYPARELPMEGVSSQLILDHVSAKNKQIIDKDNILKYVQTNLNQNEKTVLLTIGAGDIDRLVPQIADWINQIQ